MQIQREKTIWVLEDDLSCQFVLAEILDVRFFVRMFGTIEELQKVISDQNEVRPNLLIADIRLPGTTFLAFLQSRPAIAKEISVIVVSSVDDLDVLRLCFSLGVKDYLMKPFKKNELLVKVERLLDALDKASTSSRFVLDSVTMKVTEGVNETEALTAKEFQVLVALLRAPEQCLTLSELQNLIWGASNIDAKSLHVHLSHLRKKLESIKIDISLGPSGQYKMSSFIRII